MQITQANTGDLKAPLSKVFPRAGLTPLAILKLLNTARLVECNK
jgi:hypothetical protein